MRKVIAGTAVLSLLIGVGVGVFFAPTKNTVRAESVASASPEVATVPVECRSALELATTGLGAALQGLGQARSAISVARPADASSPALGVLGQSDARVQSLLQQYNQARSACTAATNAIPPAASATPAQP